MRTEIHAEKITLRAYAEDFTPLLFEAALDARADAEFRRWMPWCHADYSLADSRAFVEKAAQNWRDSEDTWRNEMQFGYAIFDTESNKFLGGVGLNQPNKIHKFFNLGYWTRPAAQKRGIASAATRALARAAFEDLPELNRVEIIAAAENIPSRKAAEKAGARFEGILRKRLVIAGAAHDAAVFALTREDFEGNEK